MKAATCTRFYQKTVPVISIHAAREGGDQNAFVRVRACVVFQSTPPVKAATLHTPTTTATATFQSTPPVKAATIQTFHSTTVGHISIHAAREGGDAVERGLAAIGMHFNPRRP